ncbi:MAG: helix-turn-helix transcriptional regulator [Mycobacterium sp.]
MELVDTATASTGPGRGGLAGVADRLLSPAPERRAEALLELLQLSGVADAGLLTAVDAAGRHLIVGAWNLPARVAASIVGRGPGRIRGALTRSLMSDAGQVVGVLYLDVAPARVTPHGLLALDSVIPHAATVAAVVSRRSRLGLTPRELDILVAIAAGYTNAEISQRDSVSVRTVTTHAVSIFRKLGVHNRVQAARIAIDCCLHVPDYNPGLTSPHGRAAS